MYLELEGVGMRVAELETTMRTIAGSVQPQEKQDITGFTGTNIQGDAGERKLTSCC